MATVAELFSFGLRYHQAGALEQAEQVYQQVLQMDPQHAGALHFLGVMAYQVGRNDLAVECTSRALRLQPNYAEAHNNLGNALQAQGKLEEATACFQQALAFLPNYAEARYNLGNALQAQGKLEKAAACYHQVLGLHPNYVKAHNNLGHVLQAQGKLDEAVACYQRALGLQPNYAEAHNNLGNVLQAQGKLEEAVTSCRQAIALKPAFAEAHNNLGAVLQAQGELEEAAASCRQALRLNPDYAEAHFNLGAVLQEQGQREEAVANFQKALQLDPDLAEGHTSLGMAWLLLGNFREGWAEYEWRWKGKGFTRPPFRQPPWDGSPLDGRTILLHAEQGLGDTLHFIRYARLVRSDGRVLVACPERLLPILSTCPGIDHLIPLGSALPPFDVHAPLMSLAGIFSTTLETIPAAVPYLFADEGLVKKWGQELRREGTFHIGIAWHADPKYARYNRSRCIPLARFAPVGRLPGVRLFSLQKGPATDQIRAVSDHFPVTDLGSRLDEGTGAFLDTAAVMKNLDLVITTDTSIGHLAGALGVPVWLALPIAPDWRWLLDREDSPWYPTMRLFRQKRAGDWVEVFEGIAAALAARQAVGG